MGREARSWAKQQRTGSATAKLVLLVMADAVRDGNEFYGSLDRLSQVTELDRRTIQRTLRKLIEGDFIIQEVRSGRTNLYRLNLDREQPPGQRGGTAPPVAERHMRQGATRQGATRDNVPCGTASRGGGRAPRGGGRAPPEYKHNHSSITSPHTHARASGTDPAGNAIRGGRDEKEAEQLVWPVGLSELERRHAEQALLDVDPGARQQIVDVLAAGMQSGNVRSRVGLIRALIGRYQAGTFDPTPGETVRKARALSRKPVRQPLPVPEPDTDEVLREHARKLGVDPDEYLARFGRIQA